MNDDVSVPYSGVYSLVINGWSKFHLQRRFFPRSGHLQHHSNPKPFADVQMFLYVQFCELLWDPSGADFMEGKPLVDNFIG